MAKLKELIAEYDANAFVFADRGNGSGFGAEGQASDYDDDAAAQYGDVELAELAEPVTSNDGMECHYASEWFASDGWPGHEWRLLF
jgi:hypothetical protein